MNHNCWNHTIHTLWWYHWFTIFFLNSLSLSGYPFIFHHPSQKYLQNRPKTKTIQLSNASITNNNLIFFFNNKLSATDIYKCRSYLFSSLVQFEKMQYIAVLIWTHCNALIKNRHLYLHIGINRDKRPPFRLQINQEDRTIHDIGWIRTIIWLKCYAYFLQHALHMHIIIMTMHFRPWLVLNLIFAAIYFQYYMIEFDGESTRFEYIYALI